MLTITVRKALHFIFEYLETRDLSKKHKKPWRLYSTLTASTSGTLTLQ